MRARYLGSISFSAIAFHLSVATSSKATMASAQPIVDDLEAKAGIFAMSHITFFSLM